jgi:hypothetical protein
MVRAGTPSGREHLSATQEQGRDVLEKGRRSPDCRREVKNEAWEG